MTLKIILSIISAIIVTIAYFPYFRDIVLLKTKPHSYTWFIWIITQCTAIAGMWVGGGNWGLLSTIFGTIMVAIVFLLSLKYGTKNITKEDTIILIAALIAVLVWWQLDQPVLSIIMVTLIDVIGYLPTFRKSYKEPWSETLVTWFMFVVSNIFAILSLSQYNLLTATYIFAITAANISLLLFCYVRRFYIPRPESLN
jgi:hypothetical protein